MLAKQYRASLSLVNPQRQAGLVVRVSTDMQVANPEGSLKNQLQRLRQHLQYKTEVAGEDWQEVTVYELRGISGKDSARSKEFEQLLADIRAGRINAVVCTALDRICRSVKDFLNFFEVLTEYGVEFVSIKENYDTTSPQGKLFVTIMMALAEFEREQTAERTRDAALARAERGLWNGGQIFGYDLHPDRKGHLVPNDYEAVVVDFAFDTYLETGSTAETAESITARGFRTKVYQSRRGKQHGGREFTYSSVQHMLKNRAYIGEKMLTDGRIVEAVWPAVVEREKYERVQDLMVRNGRTHRNVARSVRHVHILSHGLLRCGRCDGEMKGRSGTGRQGRAYFYYVCANDSCRLRVSSTEAEDAVINRIGVLAMSPESVEQLTTRANNVLLKEKPEMDKRLRALRRSLKSTEGDTSTLAKALVRASEAGVPGLNEQLARATQRRHEIEDGIVEAEQRLVELERGCSFAASVREGLANFKRVFEHLKPYEQRDLVRLVLRRATVGDRQLILELYSGALGSFEDKEKANPGVAGFAEPTIWLPEPREYPNHFAISGDASGGLRPSTRT